jgi:hypothetical protein
MGLFIIAFKLQIQDIFILDSYIFIWISNVKCNLDIQKMIQTKPYKIGSDQIYFFIFIFQLK